MERLTGIKLPEKLAEHFEKQDPLSVRSRDPFKVESFSDLVRWSAQVSCLNPALTVLYRGQRNERRNADGTLLLPSLYRWENGVRPSNSTIRNRANQLNKACARLTEVATSMVEKGLNPDEINYDQLMKRNSLQWGVMQHYEYCPTPYLDATQSLRMACMFALDWASEDDRPCVYMLGMPYMNDKYFRDSTSELMVVRLLSAMPPVAKRAYFQEGFLIGSELDRLKYTAKHDVAQRLLAKFELIGDKAEWIRQLSTFARSDVYSNDVFSEIKPMVIEHASSDSEGIAGATQSAPRKLSAPERFPSLAE